MGSGAGRSNGVVGHDEKIVIGESWASPIKRVHGDAEVVGQFGEIIGRHALPVQNAGKGWLRNLCCDSETHLGRAIHMHEMPKSLSKIHGRIVSYQAAPRRVRAAATAGESLRPFRAFSVAHLRRASVFSGVVVRLPWKISKM